MTIEQFFEDYKIKRNPIYLISPYENRMIEPDEQVELDIEEECPSNHTWTLIEQKKRFKIVTGLMRKDCIGYFISSKPWNDRKLTIEID